jgi:vitamin K-dependent gamma-carboxylase
MMVTEKYLTKPVNSASLALFRIAFGTLMAVACVRFFAHGWIKEFFIDPKFHFTYWGFEWVRPWPGVGMYVHFAVMGIAALGIALGLFYRLCMPVFFVTFTYAELIDKTFYLNHYYFVSIVSLLMCFMPLSRRWSLDAWRVGEKNNTVPAWCLNTLRAQVGVVYFFAGVAKLKPDWLVHGQPLKIWLAARADMPIIGTVFNWPYAAEVASLAGAVFDLSIVFLLLFRKSRPLAFVAVVVFHGLTGLLFNIGLFPWVMIGGASLFFAPDWPLQHATEPVHTTGALTLKQRLGFTALACHFAVQFLFPLRHHLYNGNMCWSKAFALRGTLW